MNNYQEAVELLLSGKTESCTEFFKKNKNLLELAYCYLLEGNIYNALILFKKIDSPRGLWGKRLLKIFLDEFDEVPSYFEVRDFFELDMNLFINLQKYDYANNMLKNADLFYSINSESYKFIARVLLNNGYLDPAKIYLEKSKEKFYNDPELHYIDMQYYEKKKEYNLALIAVENCLSVIPSYYPAIQAKERLIRLMKV